MSEQPEKLTTEELTAMVAAMDRLFPAGPPQDLVTPIVRKALIHAFWAGAAFERAKRKVPNE